MLCVLESDSSSQIGELYTLPHVTRKVIQSTRPSFSHMRGGAGHETSLEAYIIEAYQQYAQPTFHMWICMLVARIERWSDIMAKHGQI